MKLIDILVEELPKSGGWPRDVKTMTQDRVGNIWGYDCVSPRLKGGLWSSKSGDDLVRDSKVEARNLAVDWNTAIITREQYEAALAAKNEGWIEWGGGRRPVDDVTEVDIKFRTGGIVYGVEAGKYYWPHTGYESDIIAYRLHQSQEVAHTEEEQESYLNECVCQAPAPAWRRGLPPVGVEAEVSVDGGRTWCSYKAIDTNGSVRLIEIGDLTEEFQSNNWIFRAPLTEDDRKRKEVIDKITDAICGEIPDTGMATAAKYAARVYDAIAAGEITGINLED